MNFDLEGILIALPGVLIGLVLHEFSHAFAAHKLGDPTPAAQGRLTLNPLKHIDPLGFLFLIVAGFGWAKPVRFSREALAKPKRDEALIALAGPLSNLALALVFGAAFGLLFYPLLAGGKAAYYALMVLYAAVRINLALFLFNLIPIPPLDGSHLLFSAIRIKPETEAKLYRYGTFALLAILVIDSRTSLDLLPIGKGVSFLASQIFSLFGLSL